jgi:radical SAM protein with 4Fe4S-binding SPASM domain
MSASDAERLLGERLRKGALRAVHFQVADRCNHTCVHCYQVQGQKGELSSGQAMEALDRFASAGVFLVTISGGEATLRDDFFEIVAHARALGLAVTIYTNAFTIDAAAARKLEQLGVWRVHVSVYGPNAEVHDAVTRVPGSFERTTRGIRHLRDSGVAVIVKTPTLASNFDSLGEMESFATSLGCQFALGGDLMAREDGDLALVREQYTTRHGEVLRRRTCSIASTQLTVEPNGEVRACSAVVVPLGNVLRDSLKDIHASEVSSLLRSISVATLHGCRDCSFAGGCQRCHGTAMHEAGDLLAPYASACVRALADYEASTGVPLRIVAEESSVGRPLRLGPFRVLEPGLVRQVEDVRTPEDDARAARYPWIRPDRSYAMARVSAEAGEQLVRLRRK